MYSRKKYLNRTDRFRILIEYLYIPDILIPILRFAGGLFIKTKMRDYFYSISFFIIIYFFLYEIYIQFKYK